MIDTIGYILIALGALLMFISILGLYRFPDVFTRSHAAGIIDTGSATCVLIAAILLCGFTLTALKILLIWVFILVTSPTASHALLKAAIADGMQPIHRDESR
jgi:multicomponent Na+:H+ antiporter subunit G